MNEVNPSGANQSLELHTLARAVDALFEEAYLGPPNPKQTWFVDNEERCGFIGVLEGMTSTEARRYLDPREPVSVASHAGHLLYALMLANKAAAGEDPYRTANWAESWKRVKVADDEWAELVTALRKEYTAFRAVIASAAGPAWKDPEMITLLLAQVAHGAWHLGAIRQGLGKVRAPV